MATHKLPSRNTPLTSNFLRVVSLRSHIMGSGMHRMITSRSRFDIVIPKRNAWISLQWLENNKVGFHSADMGKHRRSSVKTLPQSHVTHRKPTSRLAFLKMATVPNTRRYKIRIEIFTPVMVRPYVIVAGITP